MHAICQLRFYATTSNRPVTASVEKSPSYHVTQLLSGRKKVIKGPSPNLGSNLNNSMIAWHVTYAILLWMLPREKTLLAAYSSIVLRDSYKPKPNLIACSKMALKIIKQEQKSKRTCFSCFCHTTVASQSHNPFLLGHTK